MKKIMASCVKACFQRLTRGCIGHCFVYSIGTVRLAVGSSPIAQVDEHRHQHQGRI